MNFVMMENSIWKHSLDREEIYTPNPFYFSQHPDLTYQMRYILLNWLIEVRKEGEFYQGVR
jgi:hypothetical protein